ncbi:synaptopodin isoform X2 [Ambystoma mexicanum]|uniref:synaptopodin isoform X2 n=1 Tax=Ambystoma mexicanum TaxID=8296 RepID=UPI0037E7D915
MQPGRSGGGSPDCLQGWSSEDLCRSASLSEKELKEAKTRSQEIAAHLTTPPGTNSRGVLLFNKRRQRVNNLTSLSNKGGSSGAITRGEQGGTLQDIPSQHGRAAYVNPQPQPKAEPEEPVSLNHFGKPLENTMEEDETKPPSEPFIGKMTDTQEEEGHGDEVPLQETPAPSTEEPSAVEVEQAPLGDTLKESLIPTPTNGAVDSYTKEIESAPAEQTEPRETPNKQYCEVHLTLSKPAPVANRTARPFGNRSPVKIAVAEVRSPTIDLPPPPTYAETQSSPTPVPHVRSPPSYSALYPTVPETRPPISLQGSGATEMRHQPMPKSGVLEDIMARRGNKKSMFTFIEKPKLAPNPDLLSLVQNADEKRKQKDHGEVLPEEELFALGAEASNFLNDSRLRGGSHIAPADIPPEWATCLKSPDLLHKPPLTPHQSLPHAGGKGAELFARRQSRMEKYVIESPTHPDMLRSPSPTMSLPPSWKYATSAHVSPTSRPFNHPAKSLQSTPKPSSNSQITNDNAETEQSQKELQISKRQPYQLQSSLFILSPVKDPVSSLPRAAPPPKPMLHDTTRYARQTSCPTSPLPPPPHVQTSGPFRSIQRATSPGGDVRSAAENTRMSFTNVPVATVVPPTSPVSFMHTRGPSPHARVNVQSPRPSFSTKTAGIESQERRASPFASTICNPRVFQHCASPDERPESATSSRDGTVEDARVISPPPPPPMSPSWSERSLSPVRQDLEPKANRQMQALLARNIINAARRKSSSPQVPEMEAYRSSTPPFAFRAQPRSTATTPTTPPWSPRSIGTRSPVIRSPLQSPVSGMTRSPLRLYTTRSPTDSDISVDSEDSGTKSPGLRSYNICPRGWNGSMRIKRGSLPVEASCTT